MQRAFRIARGHPNPEWFYYPSLLFYLIGAAIRLVVRSGARARRLAARPGDLRHRPVAVLPDRPQRRRRLRRRVSVYLIYRLGREAFSRPVGLLAALFLAVEPLHVRYSHVAVTDVPATMLGLLALLLFLQAVHRDDRRRLLAGAVVAGLATGTKYNLGMLVLPGAIACWYVGRGRLAGRPPSSSSPGAPPAVWSRRWRSAS